MRAFASLCAAVLLAAAFFLSACGGGQNSVADTLWQAGELKVHFLDVGQGDCAIVELPDGKKVMIDGGNGSAENDRRIAEYLDELGIEKLDEMILTHSDADHCGGLESVLDAVEVSRVRLPCKATLASDATYFSFYQRALETVPAVEYSRRYGYIRGDTYDYFLMFLWPRFADAAPESDPNYYSAVIWLEYEGLSVLFTGDMTAETEDVLTKEYALDSGIFSVGDMQVRLESTEVLKVAHHGSDTSSGREWLELLSPEAAVISVGAGNNYGHPSDRVVADLHAVMPDGELYRTDECGNIVLSSAGGGAYTIVCGS